MNLEFDLQRIETTEFGIGRSNAEENPFVSVPVARGVQEVLREMVETTHDAMRESGLPARYEPSEKYEPTEYLCLSVDDQLCDFLIDLHNTTNLPIDVNAIKQTDNISAYFARFTDGRNRRLTAVRQATQFKGDLKKKLMILVDDAFEIVPSSIFRLDSDFDVIIDDNFVHIWKPRAFERLFNLNSAIMNSVPKNIQIIGQRLPFIDFGSVETYASNHPLAARYLASIKSQDLNIERTLLELYCKENGVQFSEDNGRLTFEKEHVMSLLRVLDRRRYSIKLVQNNPERFVATGRRKIENK